MPLPPARHPFSPRGDSPSSWHTTPSPSAGTEPRPLEMRLASRGDLDEAVRILEETARSFLAEAHRLVPPEQLPEASSRHGFLARLFLPGPKRVPRPSVA